MVERVVVTGLGVVAPNAHGKEAFSQVLRQGKSGIRFHEHLREFGLACQVGGIPEGINELRTHYLTEEEILATSQSTTLATIAALDAWNDAGLARPAADSDTVDWQSGIIIGTCFGGMDVVAERLVPMCNAGKVRRLGSTMIEQSMISSNSARIAGLLALGNQVSTNSSACSTGNEAVVDGFLRIRAGRAKRMLAGGSEGSSKYSWAAADATKSLSRTFNDAPEKASRPMSASADGFVPSSGAGVLLLESLSTAQARGARIYAEVLAGYVNCGGQRNGGSISSPNDEGVRRCIRGALGMAGIRSEQIDAINGHLTATSSDAREIESWRVALGLPPSKMPLIQATKSLIGHAIGAAGGIECVAAVLQLDEGFVHGSINCEDLHPSLSPYAERIPHATVLLPGLRVIAKATFGFGDVNACVIFRKFEN